MVPGDPAHKLAAAELVHVQIAVEILKLKAVTLKNVPVLLVRGVHALALVETELKHVITTVFQAV